MRPAPDEEQREPHEPRGHGERMDEVDADTESNPHGVARCKNATLLFGGVPGREGPL